MKRKRKRDASFHPLKAGRRLAKAPAAIKKALSFHPLMAGRLPSTSPPFPANRRSTAMP